MIERAVDAFGGLDVLHNNATDSSATPLTSTSSRWIWRSSIDW
jgi:hypothetical protein